MLHGGFEPRWFLVETLVVWMERAYVKLSVEVIVNQFADHGLFRRDLGSGKANSQEWEWNFQSHECIFYLYFECRSGFRPILHIFCPFFAHFFFAHFFCPFSPKWDFSRVAF